MSPPIPLNVLETVVNRILSGDPDSRARLARVAGRTVRIDAHLDRDVSVYATFDLEGVRLRETFDGEVHATIAGGPLGFARAACDPGRRDVFTDGTIDVSGDALLAQSVTELFRRYRYDWQAHAQPLVGEAATARLETLLEDVARWGDDARAKLAADAGEFLREERELLASRAAVADFADAVDTLRSDVERLEKRIERLAKPSR